MIESVVKVECDRCGERREFKDVRPGAAGETLKKENWSEMSICEFGSEKLVRSSMKLTLCVHCTKTVYSQSTDHLALVLSSQSKSG